MKEFIKVRLNRDNLWNLVFFLGMTGSIAGTGILFEYEYMITGRILFFSSIFLVPYMIRTLCKVKHIAAEGKFVNSKGVSLRDRYPTLFLPIILLGVISFFVALFLARGSAIWEQVVGFGAFFLIITGTSYTKTALSLLYFTLMPGALKC